MVELHVELVLAFHALPSRDLLVELKHRSRTDDRPLRQWTFSDLCVHPADLQDLLTAVHEAVYTEIVTGGVGVQLALLHD